MFTALVSRVHALARGGMSVWLGGGALRLPSLIARSVRTGAALAALLAFSVAQADAPPLTGFPQTGQFSARYLSTSKNVAAFELAGNYDMTAADGSLNVEPRSVVSKEFLARFADKYDFIVVFTNFEFDTRQATAFYLTVKNDTKGLGQEVFDNTSHFGSKGVLQGYIDMAALSRYVTDPTDAGFDKVMQVLSHELLHRWAATIKYKDAAGKLSGDLLGRDGAHWSFLLDSGGSVEYGNRWVDNGNGTYTSRAIREIYSPLDLYLMGMLKKEEVPPFYLLRSPGVDATRLPEVGVTLPGTREAITIDQVIAANGPRVPDAATSQKQFRLGFVLLTRPGAAATNDQIVAVNNVREAFEQRLGTMTGGRSLVQAFIEPKATFHQVADPSLPAGSQPNESSAPANVSNAYAWLTGRQEGEGAWADNSLTRLRDTAVVTAALESAGANTASVQRAKGWLKQQAIGNTDYVARRVAAMGTQYVNADLSLLAAQQNADGGWGPALGYRSTPLDTALAVLAFSQDTDTARKTAVQAKARAFLLGIQNPDGGWSHTINGASRTATTTQVIRALASLDTVEPIAKAARFLAGRQNLDGGFGDSPSTVHDTANVMLVLSQTGQAGLVRSGDAVGYLNQTQHSDGSWDSSVYATSLAAQALSAARTYNWTASAFTASPDAVRDGQRVTLTIGVSNSGAVVAPAGTLRLFDGDPSGNKVITTLAVPPLAPGEGVTLRTSWSTTGLTGDHMVNALVDPDATGSEITRLDNLAKASIKVGAASAQTDLYVSPVDVVVTPGVVNRLPMTVNVAALVANIGGTDAVGVKVRLLAGPSADSLTVVDERTVNLLARSTQPVNTSFEVKRPGKQLLVVEMDPDNTSGDIDRTNNRAEVFVETTSTFDPAVSTSDLVVPAQPVVIGADVNLQATVHNRGTADSPAFQAVFSVTDGSIERVIDRSSVQLAASGSKSFTFPWRVDLTGSLQFKVALDPANAVADLDRSNNVATAGFVATTPAAGINLAVSYRDLLLDPSPLKEGMPAKVAVTVRNTGTVPASKVEVALYEGDPANGGVAIAPTVTLESIAPGGAAQALLTVPNVTGVAERLYFVAVDPANKLTESDKADNQAFQTVTVLSMADLAVVDASIEVTPLMPRPGDTAAVKVLVQNLGQQDASQVKVRLMEGATLLGEQIIAVVPAQSSAQASFSMTLPAQAAAHTLTVLVDPDNAVLEGDKSNNTASRVLAVQDGVAFISEPFFSPNGDGVKDSVDFGFRSPGPLVTRIAIVNETGALVRSVQLAPSQQGGFTWDGRDDSERLVEDGRYAIRALAADGSVVGEGSTVLDTNRTPILAAMGTSSEFYRNLSCRVQGLSEWTLTLDEQYIFAYTENGGSPGLYRISSTDGEVNTVVSAAFVNAGEPGVGLQMVSAAARGERAVFSRLTRTGDSQIWAVNGDGSGLRMLGSSADGSANAPVGGVSDLTLSHDGKTLYSHVRTKDGRDVLQRTALDTLASTVLYDSKDHDGRSINVLAMAPNRRRALINATTGDRIALMLIDLETGEIVEAPADFYQAGRWYNATLKWSPDSRYIVLWDTVEAMGTEPGNTTDYQFDVFDTTFKVVNRFRTNLGKDAGSEEQDGLISNVDWTGDSMEIVFAHEAPQYGGGQASNGTRFFYRANVQKGTLTREAPADEGWSQGAEIWMGQTGRLSLSTSSIWGQPSYYTVNINTGDTSSAFRHWYGDANPYGYPLSPAKFTPSGRRFLFTSERDSLNPQSACYQEQGLPQLFAFESLQNLVADVQVVRDSRLGGLLVTGTAADKNLSGYRLEYANLRTPNDWHPVTVPGTEPKLGERLTNWVPPAYGTYLVRMTAQDRAGNTAVAQRRVSWNDSPVINNLVLEREMFSPNGDGLAETDKLSYDVLEPVNLAFEVMNEAGERVRLAERSHVIAGKGFAFEWDGRDDAGRYVVDGKYTIRVLDYEFAVTVDTVAPELTLTSSDHTFSTRSARLDERLTVSPKSLQGPVSAIDIDIADEDLAVEVFDGIGNLVWSNSYAAPTAHIVWNGVRSDGRPAPEGTYSLQLVYGRQSADFAAVDLARSAPDVAQVTFRLYRYEPSDPTFSFKTTDPYLLKRSVVVEVGRGDPPATWQSLYKDLVSYAPLDGAGLLLSESLSIGLPHVIGDGGFKTTNYAGARIRVTAQDQAGNVSTAVSPFVEKGEVALHNFTFKHEPNEEPSKPVIFSVQAPSDFGTGVMALLVQPDRYGAEGSDRRNAPLTFNFVDSLQEPAPRVEFRYTFVNAEENGRAILPTVEAARALQWNVVPVRGARVGDQPAPSNMSVGDFPALHKVSIAWDMQKKSKPGFWLVQLIHKMANGNELGSNLYAYPVKPTPQPVSASWQGYNEPAQLCDAGTSGVGHLDVSLAGSPSMSSPLQPWISRIRIYRVFPSGERERIRDEEIDNRRGDLLIRQALPTAEWPLGRHDFIVKFQRGDSQEETRENDQTWPEMKAYLYVDHTAPEVTLLKPAQGERMCASRLVDTRGKQIRFVPLEVSVKSAYPVIGDAQALAKGDEWVTRGPAAVDRGIDILPVPMPAKRPPDFGYSPPVDCNIPGMCDFSGPVVFPSRPGNGTVPTTLKVFGVDEQDHEAPLNGEMKLRARVYGSGGHLVCRPVTVFVDGEVEASSEVDGKLISPNGDGRLDSLLVSIRPIEAVLGKVQVFKTVKVGKTTQISGPALRNIEETGLANIAERQIAWDGLDNNGVVLDDGLYVVRVTLIDDCGNEHFDDYPVEVDVTPPAIAIESPRVNSKLSLETALMGSVFDEHPDHYDVELMLDRVGAATPLPVTGRMNLAHTELARILSMNQSGTGRVIVRAYDLAGNVAEGSVAVEFAEVGNLVKSFVATPDVFSPNADGRRDTVSLLYTLLRDARVSMSVVDSRGQVVARLVNQSETTAGDRYVTWDGKDSSGQPVADQELTAVLRAEILSGETIVAQQQERVNFTLDRTPPSITFVKPAGPVTAAEAGALVRVADPMLSEATLEASANGGAYLTLAAGADVNGQLTASLDSLPEGPAKLRVTANDKAENRATSVLDVVVDRTPPKVTLVTPAANAYISGHKQATAAIEGAIEEAHLANYRVTLNDQPVFNATTAPVGGALGSWTPLSFADGPATFKLRAEDQAGLTAEVAVAVTVDNTPPIAALKASSGTTYLRVGSKIEGTASDINLQQYRVELSAGGVATGRWNELGRGTTAVNDGVLLTATALPPDGVYGLRLTVADKAGNETVATHDVTVDTTPPTPVTLTASSPNNRDAEVRWTAASQVDTVGYVLYRNGARVNPVPLTETHYGDNGLVAGSYVYSVRVIDQAGNESDPSNEGRVLISSSEPVAQIFAPLKDGYAAGLAEVRGTASASADFKEYRLYVGAGAAPTSWQLLRQSPQAITADQLATWNTVGASEGGVYTLRLEAESLVGQIARDQVSVKVKNTPPRSPLRLQGLLSNGNNIALTWTASPDENQGYLLYRDQRLANATGVVIGSLAPYLIKPTAFNDGSVPDGLHRYQVVAMDAAGNVSDPSNEVEFRVDTRAPHVAITKPAEGSKVSVSTTLVADSPDSDLASVQFQYRLAEDGEWVNIGAPLTASSGPWSITWKPEGVPLGSVQVRTVGTDEGGRVDPAPGFITLIVTDTRKPEPPTNARTRVNAGDVTVSWTPSKSAFAVGYYVERMNIWGGAERLNSEPIADNSYVDAGLGDATFSYRVVAVTAAKVESDPTAVVTAVVFTPAFTQPYSPTDAASTVLTGVTLPQHQMALRTESGDLVAQVDTDSAGTFTFAGLSLALGDNRYQLVAQDADGNISRTVGLRVMRGVAPAIPVGLQAEVTDHRVDLSWTANADADLQGYAGAVDGVSRGQAVKLVFALASSYQSVYSDPFRVLDGNDQTGWRPNNNVNASRSVVGEWVQVNLEERSLVDGISVLWARPEDVVARYVIEGFDGEVWVPLAERRIAAGDTAAVTALAEFKLDKPYMTDRLRVKLLALRTDQDQFTTQINEVKVNAVQVGAATSLSFDPLPDGRPRVGVRAVSTLGLSSGLAEASTTVGDVTPPAAPVLRGEASVADAVLSWTVSNADEAAGFRVERDGVAIATLDDATVRVYNDPSLANGSYRYTVRTRDQAGNYSEASNEETVVIAIAGPDAPVVLAAKTPAEGRRVLLDWTVGAGAQPARFELLRAETAGGPYASVAKGLDGSQRSFVDDSVINGHRYFYVVVPQGATGRAGAPSNEVAALPDDRIAPSTPYFVLPGRSPGPVLTHESITTLVGFADPGSRVIVMRGGERIGTAEANASDTGSIFYGNGSSQVFDTTPDGALTFFNTGGNGALFLADGSTVAAPALEKASNVTALRLAPDGQSAAMLRRDGSQMLLQRWNRGDNSMTKLSTDVLDGPLAFSPDGRWVAMRSWNSSLAQERLLVIDWSTGAKRELPILAAQLAWSPDGLQLAASTYDQGLVLWDSAKDSQRVVSAAVQGGQLSWQPDGQALLAETSNAQGRTVIARVALSDGGMTLLTDDGTGSSYTSPAAAPDGSGFLAVRDGYTLVRRAYDGTETMVDYTVGGYGPPRWTLSGNQVYLQSWNAVSVLLPAGQFRLPDVPLNLGAQLFGAYAQDQSGNGSGMAVELEVRRLSDKLPDWQITADSWQVYPATPQAGETANVALTITNTGADAPATDARAVVVDASGNLTVVYSGPVPALARGAQSVVRGSWTPQSAGRYVLVAAVDGNSLVTEQSEDNNLASREVLVVTQGNRPELSLATDKPRYAGGDTVAATVTAVYAGASMDAQVRLRVVDTGGYEVTTLAPKALNGLAFGTPKAVSFSWPTGTTLADSYRLVADLLDNTGAVLASATSDVILEAGAQLSATVTTDHADYLLNDSVSVQGRLGFVSGNVASLDTVARLSITNAVGEQVAIKDVALNGMLPGTEVRLDLPWAAVQAGDFTATLSAGPREAPTAQAQAVFRVGLPTAPLLQGRLQVAGDVFNTTEAISLQYSLTNRGAAVDPLPIRVRALQPGNAVQLASVSADLNGVGGTAQTRSAQLSGNWPQGSFELRLEAQLQGTWTLLDKVSVSAAEQQAPGIGFLSPIADAVVRSAVGVSMKTITRQAPITRVEVRAGSGEWTTAMPFNLDDGRYASALPGADGEVVLQARAVDSKGQTSNTAQLRVVIDNTAPVLAIAGVADGATYTAAVVPTVTITEAHPATSQVLLDGQPFQSGTQVSASGTHVLSVSAGDAAGNSSQTQLSFTISAATPPTVAFVAPAEGAVVRSSVGASAQAQAVQGAIVKVELQSGEGAWTVMSGANALYTGPLPAQDGSAVLKLRATDSLGGVSAVAQRTVVIDNTAPVVAISGVTDGGSSIGSATPVVQVTELHPGTTTLTLDGAAFVSGTSVTAVGKHVLVVAATDVAGNATQRSVSFTVAAAAGPVATFVGPAAEAVVRSQVGVTAQATSSQDTVARVELQVGEGAWIAMTAAGGVYTAALPAADGTVVLKLRAFDSRGLMSSVVQRSLTIDNTAPVVTVSGVAANGSYIGSATPVITMTEAHPGTSKVLLDGAAYVSGTPVTAVGSHVLSIEASDVAGNSAKLELSFEVKARTAPVAGFVSPAANAVVRSAVGVVAQASSEQDTVAKVELQFGAGDWTAMTASGAGRFMGALPTADGGVVMRVRATDSRGLVSAVVERAVIIDNTAPTITVSGVADGMHYTTGATPVVTITEANPGSSQVTLDGVVFSSGTKVTAVGSHVLAISATDAAGNTAQRSLSFVIDADNLPAQPAVIGASTGEPGRLLVYVACTRTADEGWNDCYQLISRGYDDEKAVWACTLDRAAWLRDYLAKRGVDAKVVTDELSFLSELRTGRYGSYWVGGGALVMGSLATAELQAAVRRGESLITEGWRPGRNDGMQYLAGISSASALSSDVANVTVSSGGLPLSKLQVYGPVRITTSGVSIAATMTTAAPGAPAIVVRPFGSGRVVSFAFDLSRSLREKSAVDASWNDLVKAALKLVAPAAKPSVVAGGIVDLRSAVSNKASSALDVELVTKAPAGMTLLAQSPVATSVKVEGGMPTVRWNATVAAGASQTFTVVAGAPETSSGNFVATTLVNVKKSGGSVLSDTQQVSIKVRSTADMIDASYGAVSDVKGLAAILPKLSALGWIAQAKTSGAFGLWQDSLRQLIAAQATMQNVSGDGAEEAKYAIARAIEAVERRLCVP